MPYPDVSRSESPPKDGVMMIEGQQGGWPIVPKYRRKTAEHCRIETKPCNPRQHGNTALHDLCSDLAQAMKAEHARHKPIVGKAVNERLDNLLGAPRDEGGGEYIDSMGLFR